jgi:hypothetical protein
MASENGNGPMADFSQPSMQLQKHLNVRARAYLPKGLV